MLLEIRNIKKYFPAGPAFLGSQPSAFIKAVDGVDLTVARGENLGLVGESGCGKTTLAKIVVGLVRPDGGRLLFEGKEVGSRPGRMAAFRKQVRMVFQDPFSSLDPRYSVRLILKEALMLEKAVSTAAELKAMERVLKAVNLSMDVLNRYPHEFSGGERQRISIARALMTNPSLLILDEAVSSLDVLVQKQILETLDELKEKWKVTYFLITHNLRVVRKISSKIAVMYKGRIVEYGSVNHIFEDACHPYTRSLLDAAIRYQSSSQEREGFSVAGKLTDVGGGHLVLLDK